MKFIAIFLGAVLMVKVMRADDFVSKNERTLHVLVASALDVPPPIANDVIRRKFPAGERIQPVIEEITKRVAAMSIPRGQRIDVRFDSKNVYIIAEILAPDRLIDRLTVEIGRKGERIGPAGFVVDHESAAYEDF